MACAGCLNGDANWKKTHTRQKGVCGAFIPATKATNVDSSAEVMSDAGFTVANSSLFSKAKAASANQPRVETVFNDDPAADDDGELSVVAPSDHDGDLKRSTTRRSGGARGRRATRRRSARGGAAPSSSPQAASIWRPA